MSSSYKYHTVYTYQFITETGQEYKILLEDYKEMSGFPVSPTCGLMFFTIKKEDEGEKKGNQSVKGKQKSKKDKRIRDTIITILLNFFQNHKDIVCYICSNEGRRAQVRHRLFRKWFDDCNPGNYSRKIQKHNNEDLIFIYEKNNLSAKSFISSFFKF